jgi:hypothetical protein
MKESELIELTSIDFPDMPPITEETRKKNIQYGCRGNVRIATGRFFTDIGYENYRKKVLSMEIP